MNEIKRVRFSDLLTRLLGMDAQSPAVDVAPEIVPVLPIEAIGPEHWWLYGGRLCSGVVEIAAVAAKRSVARLRVPTNSGVIAVVQKVIVAGATGTYVLAGVSYPTTDLAQLPAARGKTIRDTRIGNPDIAPAATLTYDQEPAGISPANLLTALLNGTTTVFDQWDVVLAPGSAMDVYVGTNNVAINIAMWWRERALPDSERIIS